MKKFLFFFPFVMVMIGCTKQLQIRDWYCGEYLCYKALHLTSYEICRHENPWPYNSWTDKKMLRDDFHELTYECEICIERSKEYPDDTTKLDVYKVIPFDTVKANNIKRINEEIRLRNELSICNEDESYLEVPEPTYHGNRTIVQHIHAYVKGKKLFFEDTKGDSYNFILPEKFDSVYMRNDTLHYKGEMIHTAESIEHPNYGDGIIKRQKVSKYNYRYIAIKKK